MIIISHRGNLSGPHSCEENSQKAIDNAINLGYNVELDLRYTNNKFFLGHDEEQYETDLSWLLLRKNFLWIHCKNSMALNKIFGSELNYFWHENDDYTLTSKGFIWAYPRKEPMGSCIMVMPEKKWSVEELIKFYPYGICTDYVFAHDSNYKK